MSTEQRKTGLNVLTTRTKISKSEFIIAAYNSFFVKKKKR